MAESNREPQNRWTTSPAYEDAMRQIAAGEGLPQIDDCSFGGPSGERKTSEFRAFLCYVVACFPAAFRGGNNPTTQRWLAKSRRWQGRAPSAS